MYMQKILDSQSLELQCCTLIYRGLEIGAKKLHSLLLREQLVDRSRLKVLEMYLYYTWLDH